MGRATFQLTADQQLYAEYVYAWNSQQQETSPSSAARTSGPDGTPILYPASGPYYPTDFANANGLTGDLPIAYRTLPLGPRVSNVETAAQRIVLGTQGSFKDWDYDAGYTYSANTAAQNLQAGYVSASALASAMYTGLINPFGPSSAAGNALLASTEISGYVRNSKGWMNAIDMHASREVFTLPGGAASLALGGEARTENLTENPGALLESGDILGNQEVVSPQQASRRVGALFVEMNLPFTRTFEADVSARYDHYSDFGGTTNPKIGVRWQPQQSLVLRASWDTGFRAPSLTELYKPRATEEYAEGDADPIRCPVTQADADCSLEYQLLTGGNPNLQPEKAKQWSAGLVWEPVTGDSISLDYWSIRKTNAIDTVDTNVVFANFGVFGNTNIVRGPVDPAYPNLPGPIIQVVGYNQNVGDVDTSGVDVDVEARANVETLGLLTFKLNGTLLTQWQQTLNGVPAQSVLGGYSIEGPVPRWRHYAALNWTQGPWGATVAQTFQSGYTDQNLLLDNESRHVGTYSIWDVQGVYTGFRSCTLTAGIHNVFNKAPPFTNQENGHQYGYDSTYGDPRGLTYYLRLTYAFK